MTVPRHRVAIVQSAYVPWKGFFDLIARCDEYVIFDQVQFAKRHWHNRNLLKTPQGTTWITIPVDTKSRFEQAIEDVRISQGDWAERHWRTIKGNYSRAPHFARLGPIIEDLYGRAGGQPALTSINELLLRALCGLLGIRTRISRDTSYAATGTKTDRLLDICLKAGATHYLSGPAAKSYLEEAKFAAAGIAVEWMTYGGYPPYPQQWGPFEPAVSILDLLFNVGESSPEYWNTSSGLAEPQHEPSVARPGARR